MRTFKNKRKILIISQHPPIPNNGGGKLLLNRFKYLSQYYDLHIVTKIREEDLHHISEFSEYFTKINLVKKIKPRENIVLFLWQNLLVQYYVIYNLIKNKYIAIHLEYTWSIIYIYFVRLFIKTPVYITEHDISYISYYSKVTHLNKNDSITKLKMSILKKIEIHSLNCFTDKIIVWGNDDKQQLIKDGVVYKKVTIIPPIMEEKYIWKGAKNNTFLFVGSGNHKPNVDSLNYIIKHIWPIIRKKFMHAQLFIIGGMYKSKSIDSNIVYLNFVPNMDDYIINARALLAPIIWGAGIKVKIIEAFSKGIPVITNEEGITNLDNFNIKDILICGDLSEFIEKYKNNTFLTEISASEVNYSNKFKASAVLEKYFELYD